LLLNLARIGLSAALLTWALWQAGLERLLGVVSAADWRPYLLALLLGQLGIVIRAYRWKVLLDAVGARVPFARTVYLYFVGAFFNTFLPTGFGGDVVRALEAGPGTQSSQAAGTIVVDRLTGFIMLFVLALVALPAAWGTVPQTLLLPIGGLAAGVLAGSALLFEGRLLRRITGRLPRAISLAGEGWLARTYSVITACGRAALLRALTASLIYNLGQTLGAWLIARALNLDLSFWTLLAFVPIATVALLVPVTIGGLGLREGIYVVLFAQIGLGSTAATAFSLAVYSVDVATGIMGGVIYLVSGVLGLRRTETTT
jgi:uncharacterized membrane protein YbhN (UPF0104 family)